MIAIANTEIEELRFARATDVMHARTQFYARVGPLVVEVQVTTLQHLHLAGRISVGESLTRASLQHPLTKNLASKESDYPVSMYRLVHICLYF